MAWVYGQRLLANRRSLQEQGVPGYCFPFVLARAGYRTIAELRGADDAALLALPMFGPRRLARLRTALEAATAPLPWWTGEE